MSIQGTIRGTNVRLYAGEPGLYFNDPDGPVIRDLDRRMSKVQRGAQIRVRVRSGKLLSTIRKNRGFQKRGPFVDVLAGGRGASYVMYEHDGTRPHMIFPRRRKALRWAVGGSSIGGGGLGGSFGGTVVFARAVRHPGTKGSHFLTASLPLAGD